MFSVQESNTLTPDEEKQMDFISNAIIDIILAGRDKNLKIPLPYLKKSNSLDVKGSMKREI